MARGEADAFIFDRPQLQHYLSTHPDLDVVLSRSGYLRQGYGFALRLDTPILHNVNVALLRTAESGRTKHITESWLGASDDEPSLSR